MPKRVRFFLEDDEMLEQVEEPLSVEHSANGRTANNLKRDEFAEEGTSSVLIDRERGRSYQRVDRPSLKLSHPS